MYEQSIHNRAIVDKGLNKSATCVDCHGAHDMKDRRDPASSINKPNLPATCGKCHFGVYAIYKESVHGTALARGVPDAPNCADCHGEHDIRAVADPNSPVSSGAISRKTCASCHAAEKLAARYGVPVDKVRGYEQSFHGLSARLGDKTVANCASCHGDACDLPLVRPALHDPPEEPSRHLRQMPPRRHGELRQREHPRGSRRHGRQDQVLGGAVLHLADRRGDRRDGRPQRLRLLPEDAGDLPSAGGSGSSPRTSGSTVPSGCSTS